MLFMLLRSGHKVRTRATVPNEDHFEVGHAIWSFLPGKRLHNT